MKYMILVLVLFSTIIKAQSENSIEKELSGMKINKDDIRKSLEMLKKDGKISNQDYLKSLKDLNAMDESSIKEMQKKATDMVINHPEEAQKLIDKAPLGK